MNNYSTKPSINIVEAFKQSWNTLTSNVWMYAGFTLLYFIVGVAIVKLFPMLSNFGSIFALILNTSIFSAFYNNINNQSEVTFDDFFKWKPKFGRIMIGHLILYGFSLVLIFIFGIIAFAFIGIDWIADFIKLIHQFNFELFSVFDYIAKSVITFLVVATLLYALIYSLGFFAYAYIIQFSDMNFGSALKYSFKIGIYNALTIILFSILSLIISILGLMFCGVGLLFTTPWILGAQYFLLKGIVRHENKEDSVDLWDINKLS